MGKNPSRKARKPQPDGKQVRKKKTLKEAASEISAEIREEKAVEARRHRAEAERAEEDAVALMMYGPPDLKAAG